MMAPQATHRDLADFENLKRQVDARFPPGRFVAIESGQVVADAENHRRLVEQLKAAGKSPRNLLIVEAGIEYPTSATIFI
jgi:hypothetical protein